MPFRRPLSGAGSHRKAGERRATPALPAQRQRVPFMVFQSSSLSSSSPSPDTLSAADAAGVDHRVHCLSILADPQPGLIERVVGTLSKRGLLPERLVVAVDGDRVALDLQASGLEDKVASHLAARLRAMPGVISVLLCLKNGCPAE